MTSGCGKLGSRASWLTLAAAVACGRIGYDEIGAGSGMPLGNAGSPSDASMGGDTAGGGAVAAAGAVGGSAPAGGAGGSSGAGGRSVSGGGAGRDAGASSGGAAGSPPTGPGYALSFTGAEGSRLARPVDGDFTLEMWVKTSMPRTGSTWWYYGAVLFFSDTTAANSNDFGMSVLNGKLALGTGNPDTTASSVTSIDTGQWVHAAATRVMSTGVLTVFVNGVQEARRTSPNVSRLGASAFGFIGDQSTGNYAAFIGVVDELRAWDVAHTAAEISATMNKPLLGNEPHLVGYWRCDDAAGAVAADSSPRNAAIVLDAVSGTSPNWVVSDAPISN